MASKASSGAVGRRAAVAGAAAGGVLLLGGCTVVSNAPDQEAIVYNGGFSAHTFNSCVSPSQRSYKSPFADPYTYPAGQRTLLFSNERQDNDQSKPLVGDTAAYTAPSKDQQLLTVTGQLRYQLTSDCKVLQQFHEKIGIKYNNGADWGQITKVYLEQPLQLAITNATQEFGWGELYSNIGGAQGKWEAEVKRLLPGYITQAAGGDYFTNVDVTLQKPAVDPKLQDSINAVAVAVQDNQAQLSRNTQVLSEADGLKPLVALFHGDMQALDVYLAIKTGRITVIPGGNSLLQVDGH